VNDANGIYDDELIEELGYALFARCESFLLAADAAQGRVICPVCSAMILHTGKKDEVLRCSQCEWEMVWKEYFATFQHKQLYGAEPVLELFRDFVKRFPSASKLPEKVLMIDTLIHGFHWNQKYGFTRPIGINLIEGKLSDVITFLDRLTYGAQNTKGVQETHAEWVKRTEYVRSWAFPKSSADEPNEHPESDEPTHNPESYDFHYSHHGERLAGTGTGQTQDPPPGSKSTECEPTLPGCVSPVPRRTETTGRFPGVKQSHERSTDCDSDQTVPAH
jgi:hypothetical protein